MYMLSSPSRGKRIHRYTCTHSATNRQYVYVLPTTTRTRREMQKTACGHLVPRKKRLRSRCETDALSKRLLYHHSIPVSCTDRRVVTHFTRMRTRAKNCCTTRSGGHSDLCDIEYDVYVVRGVARQVPCYVRLACETPMVVYMWAVLLGGLRGALLVVAMPHTVESSCPAGFKLTVLLLLLLA